MKRIMKKIFLVLDAIPIKGIFGKVYTFISVKRYMQSKIRHMKKLGIHIEGMPRFIATSAYFDGNNYGKITICDKVTVSREAMFLTHDFSIANAIYAHGDSIGEQEEYLSKKIYVGENSFIGARVSLLPGTHIGKHCIIGAGAVVKGDVPDYSIVAGNPGKVIGNTLAYAEKHLKEKDYLIG